MIMRKLLSQYHGLSFEEKGATMVEYALLLSLLSLIAMSSIQVVGNQAEQAFSAVGNAMDGNGMDNGMGMGGGGGGGSGEGAGAGAGGGGGAAGGGDGCIPRPGSSCCGSGCR